MNTLARHRVSRPLRLLLLLAAVVAALAGLLLSQLTDESPGAPKSWEGFRAGNWPGANWRPYDDSSPFNRPATRVRVHPDSRQLVDNLVDSSRDFGHPTYYATTSDPRFRLRSNRGSPIDGLRIPIPDRARPASGDDGHMTVVTPDGWEYDFWQVTSKPRGGGTLRFNGGGRTRIDGDGLRSYGTAARFGNLAGIIRAPELAAGRIDHALFIVLGCAAPRTAFGWGTKRSRSSGDSAYVYPATHGAAACAAPRGYLPPVGARLRLAMSDAEINALAAPAWKKTILRAFARYGGYVGDTGGPGFAFMFESGSTYTSFGVRDPLERLAEREGVPLFEGVHVFDIADGIDWRDRLRVLVPPKP